tara:strand:+ start:13290 stop:14807 length:1518 start_codon:yes stop_codon:yes gene_type:complete
MLSTASAAVLLATAMSGQSPAQTIPPEILQQMQSGGIPGMSPLETQTGTWLYPVRSGLQAAMMEGREIGTANGVDADFLARSSLQAVYTQSGTPPTCDGNRNADMRGRSRMVAMEVWTGSGPFLAEGQMSRLVVNQELSRAVIYLHGDVREWVPGPNFCDDQAYVLAGSGRGFLRLEYETTAHIAPLNFTAYPHPATVDLEAFADNCRQFSDRLRDSYAELNRRWSTISIPDYGPVDWSTYPPVPEGFNNGEQASFADGLFNTRQVVDAASQAADAIGVGQAVAEFFGNAPTLARGASGIAVWAIGEATNYLAGEVFVDPAEAMMMIAWAGDAAYRSSGDPSARAVSEHARQDVPGRDGNYRGLNVDYMMHTLLDACEAIDELEAQPGNAFGYLSWPGGAVSLTGRGLAPGAPAAIASGPVQSGSMADALALAQTMGGGRAPTEEEIQRALPEGFSLEALPAPMTGQAGGGGLLAPNAPEWFVSYNIELVDEGERIATLWFDPRR